MVLLKLGTKGVELAQQLTEDRGWRYGIMEVWLHEQRTLNLSYKDFSNSRFFGAAQKATMKDLKKKII
eukprot:snap_masked-scaffold_5-processed-gene-11.29-mRNA-1 protein AED:1.00 eAED:1.00 QI:0/0/0/0/1/1/2/0/67